MGWVGCLKEEERRRASELVEVAVRSDEGRGALLFSFVRPDHPALTRVTSSPKLLKLMRHGTQHLTQSRKPRQERPSSAQRPRSAAVWGTVPPHANVIARVICSESTGKHVRASREMHNRDSLCCEGNDGCDG